jgi:hypothetical protein
MTREYIERQPGWVATFRCLRLTISGARSRYFS